MEKSFNLESLTNAFLFAGLACLTHAIAKMSPETQKFAHGLLQDGRVDDVKKLVDHQHLDQSYHGQPHNALQQPHQPHQPYHPQHASQYAPLVPHAPGLQQPHNVYGQPPGHHPVQHPGQHPHNVEQHPSGHHQPGHIPHIPSQHPGHVPGQPHPGTGHPHADIHHPLTLDAAEPKFRPHTEHKEPEHKPQV